MREWSQKHIEELIGNIGSGGIDMSRARVGSFTLSPSADIWQSMTPKPYGSGSVYGRYIRPRNPLEKTLVLTYLHLSKISPLISFEKSNSIFDDKYNKFMYTLKDGTYQINLNRSAPQLTDCFYTTEPKVTKLVIGYCTNPTVSSTIDDIQLDPLLEISHPSGYNTITPVWLRPMVDGKPIGYLCYTDQPYTTDASFFNIFDYFPFSDINGGYSINF